MKWISLFLFFCLHIHAENLGIAPLDPDYESRFYSIYNKYHSRQMSIGEWQGLISQKNIHVYTMQKGDNLWDISNMLFGNSNHWPKLWSVNADLSNPHRISVGHQVQVIMGSEGQEPRAVISGQTANQEISAPSTQGQGTGEGAFSDSALTETSSFSKESFCVKDLGLILHKAGSTSVYDKEIKCKTLKKKLQKRKVEDTNRLKNYYVQQKKEGEETGLKPFMSPGQLGVIPKSMPPVQLTSAQGINIVGLGRNVSADHKNIVVNYQVDINDIDIVGNVFNMPDGISVPTSEIIVEMDVPARSGDVFSVIHPARKLSTPSLFIPGPVGYEVIFQAQIKVTGAVPRREGLYFVEVTDMYNDVNEKSKVIREAPSVFDFQTRVRSGQTRAQITAIPRDQSSLALTVHSFIYINRGKNNNVNVGDTFNVQANPRFHTQDFGKSLGRVVIVHTAGDFSTGFVTHLNGVAYPGDYLEPLDVQAYTSDAEVDDIYEADEEEDMYEEEEEEDFAAEEEDSSPSDTSFEDEISSEQEDNLETLDEEPELILESNEEDAVDEPLSESVTEEEEEPSLDETQGEDSVLDDFEDEEMEWDEK